jgi:hypothetical protein
MSPRPPSRAAPLSCPWSPAQKDLASKIQAVHGEECSEGVTGIGDPARRAVPVSVACISRAGQEPGYKKTNQDSCFAFEKYISEDESLFGAMDGHGPHGAQRAREQAPGCRGCARSE